MAITIDELKQCYASVVAANGLITLTKSLRNNERIRHQQLRHLFDNLVDWNKRNTASGHLTYENKVTGIKVTFQGHSGGRQDPTVKKVIADDILKNVQLHLNILCNIIFRYQRSNWKDEPRDWNQCLSRYTQWIADDKPLAETSEERRSISI